MGRVDTDSGDYLAREDAMTEGEATDRLIHAMTVRHTNWSTEGPGMQAFMNRAVDSMMKDCVEGRFGFEAVAAIRAW